jgi:Protein of unknown function (DUF3987)
MSSTHPPELSATDFFIPTGEAGPPLPLEDGRQTPAFPVEVLPEPVRLFVEEGARSLGCPLDYLAVPALVVAGAALGKACRLSLTPTHQQQAALFGLVVGPPGSGKSPALALVLWPLLALEECRRDCCQFASERWLALPEEERGRAPQARRWLTTDFSTETLVPFVAAQPQGILVARDDLGGLIQALSRSRKGVGQQDPILLQLWSGTDLVVKRKGRRDPGSLVLDRPFVAVIGGIQSTLLERLRPRGRSGFKGEDGILAPFLVACPEPAPARREEWEGLSGDLCRAWYEVIECLAAVEGEAAEPEGRSLRLSESGRAAWERFTAGLADERNAADFPAHLQGTWGKLRGQGGRLALVLHVLPWAAAGGEGEFPPLVEGSTVDQAARLIDYFKGQARRLHGCLESDPGLAGAGRILAWLRRHPEAVCFSRRDLYQALRKSFLQPAALDAPLRLLVEHRYLSAIRVGTVTDYQVNPLWDR